jgi:predicted signal transduction protein with EAL and GGDEF domain
VTGRLPRRHEEGYVSIELVAGLAVLVAPIALVVLTLPTWFARQNVARLAAQQAARTAAVTLSAAQGTAIARAIGVDNHLDPARGELSVAFDPASSFGRGGTITAEVTVRMPLTVIPALGTIGGFSLTEKFSESIDKYRSLP